MNYQFKDPISGLTHLAGAFLGVLALIFLVYESYLRGTSLHVLSFAIFGVGLILLYSSSALYHLINIPEDEREVYRRIDHAMIFLLIAASYTPFCLIPLKGIWGWSILAVIWGLTFLGILTSVFWRSAPEWFRVVLYLFMGWLVVVVIFPLMKAISTPTMVWLAIGGAFYTVGAVIYSVKWPDPIPDVFGFHEVWHLFVLGGSASHVVAVYLIL